MASSSYLNDFPPLPGLAAQNGSAPSDLNFISNLTKHDPVASSFDVSYVNPMARVPFSADDLNLGVPDWGLSLVGYSVGPRPTYLSLQNAIRKKRLFDLDLPFVIKVWTIIPRHFAFQNLKPCILRRLRGLRALFIPCLLVSKIKMTEYCFFPKKLQDTHIENSSKKSPLVLKMVVLAAAMSCSVCICSFFLEQMEEPSKLHIMRANLTEKAQFHVVGVNLIDKTRPNLLRVNLTEKNLPNLLTVNLTEKNAINLVRVDLTEKNMGVNLTEVNLPHLVSLNASEITFPPTLKVNLTDETLPHVMGVNLTKKLPHDPKLSESQLRHFNYNKTKAYGREEHGCLPVSLYAIVSKQRSGSKWFEALLNSHENIRSHGEIFYSVDRKCNMTVIKTVLDKLYSLNWNASTFRRKKKSCMAAVGFKWMLNQGILDNHEGIVDYLNHRGVSVILLLRRNHLRRLVSLKANNHDGKVKGLNGAHKAHVSSKQEAEILASYKPKLDVKRLIPALEHMERLATDTLKNFRGTRHMVVYYEDLVQNQTQTMMEVLEFLKVPQRTLISGHVKIHTRPLAQQIQNWRAVAKVIKRSKYKRFITVNDYEI